ncbi:MAG: hypothetical protein WCT22_05735 [Patescibacteria group bacterium]|jgi:hypothetical protein
MEKPIFHENPLKDFRPDDKRNDNQILEEYLLHSRAYHELTLGIKGAQSFEEVNQLLSSFNESDDAGLIGDKFKQYQKEYIKENEHLRTKLAQKVSFTQMLYIEKSDRRSVQRIDISFNFKSGKIEATNGMKRDGSFKGMWDDIDE